MWIANFTLAFPSSLHDLVRGPFPEAVCPFRRSGALQEVGEVGGGQRADSGGGERRRLARHGVSKDTAGGGRAPCRPPTTRSEHRPKGEGPPPTRRRPLTARSGGKGALSRWRRSSRGRRPGRRGRARRAGPR